jgi:hypothetical protein
VVRVPLIVRLSIPHDVDINIFFSHCIIEIAIHNIGLSLSLLLCCSNNDAGTFGAVLIVSGLIGAAIAGRNNFPSSLCRHVPGCRHNITIDSNIISLHFNSICIIYISQTCTRTMLAVELYLTC